MCASGQRQNREKREKPGLFFSGGDGRGKPLCVGDSLPGYPRMLQCLFSCISGLKLKDKTIRNRGKGSKVGGKVGRGKVL